MKTIIVLIALLFSLPAAGYEVIFHQGFEGEQFPPDGWTYGGAGSFERAFGGYESEGCGRIMSFMSEGYEVESCDIPITGGELYEFRIYSSASEERDGYHWAAVFFDEGTYYSLGLPFFVPGWYDWTLFAIQEYAPLDAEYVYFVFSCGHPGLTEYITWRFDNVSVIHTATTVTPTSLGCIKAAYR